MFYQILSDSPQVETHYPWLETTADNPEGLVRVVFKTEKDFLEWRRFDYLYISNSCPFISCDFQAFIRPLVEKEVEFVPASLFIQSTRRAVRGYCQMKITSESILLDPAQTLYNPQGHPVMGALIHQAAAGKTIGFIQNTNQTAIAVSGDFVRAVNASPFKNSGLSFQAGYFQREAITVALDFAMAALAKIKNDPDYAVKPYTLLRMKKPQILQSVPRVRDIVSACITQALASDQPKTALEDLIVSALTQMPD